MGREVTRPYKATVRSDYNESYLSRRVVKRKPRKRDTMIRKPADKKAPKKSPKPMVNKLLLIIQK